MKDWKKELNEILNTALKKKDTTRINVIKMIKSDLVNAEIENNRKKLKEDQVANVFQHAAKTRREAIAGYKKAKMPDRVKEEQKKLKVIMEFLPDQLDKKEIEKIVDKTRKEEKAKDIKDMGKVMGAIMKKFQGKVDGKIVQDLARKKLPIKAD